MKKLAALVIASAVSVSAYGQGQLAFQNFGETFAPIYDSNGVEAGSAYSVGLYWGAAGSTEDSLQLLAGSITQLGNPLDGYFSAPDYLTLPTTGNVAVQVRVWLSTLGSYENAVGVNWGKSDVLTIALATGTTLPNDLPSAGLGSFTVQVPEPSVFALAGLGGSAMLMFRRRK